MTNDTATYRAVQAVAPGQLELTTKPLREPPPGYVRIGVEACGVCHSAAGTVAAPRPPVVAVVPWPALAAWAAGTFAVLALAGWLATRALIGSGRAGRLSRRPGTERRAAPRESVVR